MKEHPQPHDDAHGQLKFENELLKIKLGLEFGMQHHDSHLEPALENEWLKNIYEFEKQFRKASRITVYELIGRPDIPMLSDLKPKEVTVALKRVVDLLEQNSVAIDWCCKYDETVMYQFITEEFFKEEIDHVIARGFIQHFSYESFHPNHRYDLEECARYFLQSLFEHQWNGEFDSYLLDDMVMWRGKSYDRKGIDPIIGMFQSDRTFEIASIDFRDVVFNIEAGTGCLDCNLAYRAFFQQQGHLFQGDARFTFNFDSESWRISSFHIPGF